MLEIRPLLPQDAELAAKAHFEYLSSAFHTAGGLKMLKLQYISIATHHGAAGYAAWVDGQFAGYVCGVWDHAAVKRGLAQHWLALLVNVARHVLSDPVYLLYRFQRLFRFRESEPVYTGYELRPIVVLPAFRGAGIADQLVLRLIDDARARGYDSVFLFVEQNNPTAIRFYRRFGFVFEQALELNRGTRYAMRVELFRYHIPAQPQVNPGQATPA